MSKSRTWTCPLCNEEHQELPTAYGAEAPWRVVGVSEAEFEPRVIANDDLCVVDHQHFFVRGHVELPISGTDELFSWSVWCSLSKESFERLHESWHDPARSEQPPFFGWLMTALPTYPSTLHLKTNVHNRDVGRVPSVELEPTDHPLAVEQRTGITWRRVQEIAHVILGHDS